MVGHQAFKGGLEGMRLEQLGRLKMWWFGLDVGGAGFGGNQDSGTKAGGFNGGGSGVRRAGGGGGASDLRFLSDDLLTRVIVAGGGGGALQYNNGRSGGYGGGASGGNRGWLCGLCDGERDYNGW